jgi:hypothetical protein
MGGLVDQQAVAAFPSALTAILRDADLAAASSGLRARSPSRSGRGRRELREELDLTLLEPALAGIALHRSSSWASRPDLGLITRV